MKRMLVMTMAGIMALSMVACGQQADTAAQANTEPAAQVAEETESQPQEVVGMANPWHDITEEEADEIVPKLFKVPEGAANVKWSKCDSESDDVVTGELVQVTFDLDSLSYTARAQVTGDNYNDISGIYYQWTSNEEVTLANWGGGNMKGNTYRSLGDEGTIDLITWYDVEVGISYSLSTTAKDLDGFDIQAVAEQMYDETKQPGYNMPDDEEEYQPMDITGCDTFTQIVDKLENGQAYANATIGTEDVLLVASGAYEVEGQHQAIDAEIYKYTDGAPEYVGFVQCGGTAYPLSISKDGMLLVGSNHWIKKYTLEPGWLVIDEEASVEYDTDGGATYYHHSDLRDVGADENGQVEDDSIMTAMFGEYDDCEIIDFSVVTK
ncbi:MAG: hypothetical protein E7307_13025 [Butyrivibrio sp.]|nr:hypothetical protein [Butyrivibrio sp.]